MGRPSTAQRLADLKAGTGVYAHSPTAALATSPRMRQVCAMVAAGMSDRAIAFDLDLCDETVRTMRKRIYKLLGVHSRDELVAHVNSGEWDEWRHAVELDVRTWMGGEGQ